MDTSRASRVKRDPAGAACYLTDDLLVEILSRLPARSVSRCKAVSRGWRDLISHPDHRRRLAQPLLGFFHHQVKGSPPPTTRHHLVHHRLRAPPTTHFTALQLHPPPAGPGAPPPLAAVDPAFPFLPPSYTTGSLLDSCNGLLLLRCRRAAAARHPLQFYVVCNPTTQDWVELPDLDPDTAGDDQPQGTVGSDDTLDQFLQNRLGPTKNPPAILAFDPAVSSYFHVFELVEQNYWWSHHHGPSITAMHIYSSETGEWVLRDSDEWTRVHAVSYTAGQHAYLDGFLHLASAGEKGVVASVDTEGRTWRITRVSPERPATLGAAAFLGRSQRRLLYVDTGGGGASAGGCGTELSVYALEQWRWVLKCRTRLLSSSSPQMWFGKHHGVVAIHPDFDVIFLFDSRRKRVIAYDMEHGRASIVHSFTDASCGLQRYFPYIPLYNYSLKRLSM